MIKEIVKDESFLSVPSVPATIEDLEVARDLVDTLIHHQEECVGLAANMIGKSVCIIAVNIHGTVEVMLNPVITKSSAEYETEEGCLSLEGMRKTRRYKSIEVEFDDLKFRRKSRKFSGLSAQIIQHEIDHLKGIII
ncbi:MAG: peptide deformylase [Succinivibrio sp.]